MGRQRCVWGLWGIINAYYPRASLTYYSLAHHLQLDSRLFVQSTEGNCYLQRPQDCGVIVPFRTRMSDVGRGTREPRSKELPCLSSPAPAGCVPKLPRRRSGSERNTRATGSPYHQCTESTVTTYVLQHNIDHLATDAGVTTGESPLEYRGAMGGLTRLGRADVEHKGQSEVGLDRRCRPALPARHCLSAPEYLRHGAPYVWEWMADRAGEEPRSSAYHGRHRRRHLWWPAERGVCMCPTPHPPTAAAGRSRWQQAVVTARHYASFLRR